MAPWGKEQKARIFEQIGENRRQFDLAVSGELPTLVDVRQQNMALANQLGLSGEEYKRLSRNTNFGQILKIALDEGLTWQQAADKFTFSGTGFAALIGREL